MKARVAAGTDGVVEVHSDQTQRHGHGHQRPQLDGQSSGAVGPAPP